MSAITCREWLLANLSASWLPIEDIAAAARAAGYKSKAVQTVLKHLLLSGQAEREPTRQAPAPAYRWRLTGREPKPVRHVSHKRRIDVSGADRQRTLLCAAVAAQPARVWTTDELAAVACCSLRTLEQRLDDLVAEGLLEDVSEGTRRRLRKCAA